jgi:hypothetical protein
MPGNNAVNGQPRPERIDDAPTRGGLKNTAQLQQGHQEVLLQAEGREQAMRLAQALALPSLTAALLMLSTSVNAQVPTWFRGAVRPRVVAAAAQPQDNGGGSGVGSVLRRQCHEHPAGSCRKRYELRRIDCTSHRSEQLAVVQQVSGAVLRREPHERLSRRCCARREQHRLCRGHFAGRRPMQLALVREMPGVVLRWEPDERVSCGRCSRRE